MGRGSATFVHALTVVSAIPIILSVWYFFAPLTAAVSFITVATCLVVGWLTRPKEKPTDTQERFSSRDILLFCIFIFLEFGLIAVLAVTRTGRPVQSPWDIVPVGFLAAYGFVSLFFLLVTRIIRPNLGVVAAVIHAFTTWSIVMITYKLGFGFDPFVHQATELAIFQHGFILPKHPFYLGQYTLVVALAQLTHISINFIDRVLVPVFASLTIPPALLIGLRSWTKHRISPIAAFALFLVPLSVFTFTIPFSLSVIFFLLTVLLLPLAESRRTNIALLFLACASAAAHPLLGIPALVVAVAAIVHTRHKSWIVAVGIPTILLCAFVVYAIQNHATLNIPSLATIRDSLLALFGNPYDPSAPWLLTLFYAVARVWPFFLIVVSLIVVIRTKTVDRKNAAFLVAASVGIFLAALGIGIFIRLPGIIANEQFEFALRLLSSIPLVFMPVFALAIFECSRRLRPIGSIIFFIVLAFVGIGTLYLDYPQNNAAMHSVAPSLSNADYDAVDAIEVRANAQPYIVLSHQMMGAAALTRFGFDRNVTTATGPHYFYAIPTGDEFYTQYLRILDAPDPAPIIAQFFQTTDVPLLYIAVPTSWDPDGRIDHELTSHATWSLPIDHTVTIYEFTNKKTAARE